MSKLEAVLAAFAMTTLLAACDSEESCSDEQSGCTIQRPQPDDREPGGKPDLPEPCVEACNNLLGACDDQIARIDDGIPDQVQDCGRRCPIDFTASEIECLAALECGGSTDVCLP